MVFSLTDGQVLNLNIKSLRKSKVRKKSKRIKLRKVLQLIGLRKKVLVKWRFVFFWGLNRAVKKRFFFLRKRKMFPFILKSRNASVFKKVTFSLLSKVPFNVFFLIQSKYDYFRLKADLDFSLKARFDFKFVSFKRNSISQLLLGNVSQEQLEKVLNGSLVVLQMSNLFSLVENINFFMHESSKCLGVLFYNRIVSLNYISSSIGNFLKNFKWMSSFYLKNLRFVFKKLESIVYNYICFFMQINKG